jgi:probable H4MPT-linked C1 transfer pathway protein
LIPLSAGSVAARGRTDTERLRSGELVYAGVRRTPLCALADRLPFRGRATALAAELFATTLDAFLTLGEIPEDAESRQTADGRPATTDAALDRLARMVGADREGFTPEDALRFSEAVREALLMRLTEAATLTRGEFGRPEVIVVGGSGEFLARRLARRLLAPRGAVVSLSETWGPSASAGGCAWALIEIVRGSAKKSHT